MGYKEFDYHRDKIRKEKGYAYLKSKDGQRRLKSETKPGFVRGYKRKYNPETGWSQVPRSGLASAFLRYFTLFLVCIMLFCIVTGAPYSTYKLAVSAIYGVTETVGGVVTSVAKGVLGITTVVGSGFGLQGTSKGVITTDEIQVRNGIFDIETYKGTIKFSVQKVDKKFLWLPKTEYVIKDVIEGNDFFRQYIGATIQVRFGVSYSIASGNFMSLPVAYFNGTYTPNETSEGG